VSGFLLTLGLLALAACGGPGAGAAATKPTPTPNAQTILANASKVDYKDIEFKMTFSGSSSGTSATGTGIGTITKSPKRADIKLTVAADGQNLDVEVLEDGDANVTYVKVSGMSALGIPDDKWIKESGSGSLSSLSDLFTANQVTSFKDLQGVSLVGSETVDGVAVWHLKGNATESGTSGTADFYVRQSDNTPYKFVIHATGASSGDFTITFTGVNTGATVTLPTPDQIMTLPGA
jgi:hypothetical protein